MNDQERNEATRRWKDSSITRELLQTLQQRTGNATSRAMEHMRKGNLSAAASAAGEVAAYEEIIVMVSQ